MAKKEKTETTNVNNLRTAGFAEFEATHEFTAESKKAEFTRAAIKAGLTNEEIIEIGDPIYGEGEIKVSCLRWYRSSDPVLNPDKTRYKATGAKSIEVRAKVLEYINGLADDADKEAFINELVKAIGTEGLIQLAKVETLKAVAPADLFPTAVKKEKKEMSEKDKLIKKAEAAEKRAEKLRAELAAASEEVGQVPEEAGQVPVEA